jgi:hypothetical protein
MNLRVNTFIDIGYVFGLTPAGTLSKLNRKSSISIQIRDKPRHRNIAQDTEEVYITLQGSTVSTLQKSLLCLC